MAADLEDLATRFSLYGYSPWSAERIFSALDSGSRIADLSGDFTAVASTGTEAQPRVRMVTSLVAARPVYWARAADGRFVHGPSVFGVVRDAGLGWRWNGRAVACLALLGHTVGEDTLHPEVARLPYASTVTVDAAGVKIERRDQEWTAVFAQEKEARPETAVAVLEKVFGEMIAAESVVSLSGGFDSRLLLALALRFGMRPLTLTMGSDASTDMKVARQIAGALGLEHLAIELQAADYLKHARSIVAATSGSKTAAHWHTDLYVRAAGLTPGTVHYVGSNGEAARSFFFDRGLAARAAALGPSVLVEAYLAAKLARRQKKFPPSLFARGQGPLACAHHAARSSIALTRGFLDGLDCFYSTERVRHFIGNGLALYAEHGAPRSPFLDARWIRAIAALPRSERLGSNYHRRAIAHLWPSLMAFPLAGEVPLQPRAPALYHLRKARAVGYSPFGRVLADPNVAEVIADASDLDDLIPRRERLEALAKYPESVELLLTLAVAGTLGREAAAGRAQV